MSERGPAEALHVPKTETPYNAILNKLSIEKRKLDLETKNRQDQILMNLPDLDTLTQRLYGHLQSQYIDGFLIKGKSSPADEEASIAGELSEILTQTEYDLYPLKLDDTELTESQDYSDREVSEKLLGVLHNPQILIPDRTTHKNPDLAWLDITDRTVRVIGEVKLGRQLNYRCFRQLLPTGFIANIRDTINYLNKHPKYGKKVFGSDSEDRPQKGRISPNVIEVVFMPRDTNIKKDNWKKLIKTKSETSSSGLYPDEVEEFLKLLNSGQVKLAHLSFSRSEITELTKAITAKIREKYLSI